MKFFIMLCICTVAGPAIVFTGLAFGVPLPVCFVLCAMAGVLIGFVGIYLNV